MSWFALWLLALGLTDLVRATRSPSSARLAVPVGVAALALLAGLSGIWGPADLVALAGAALSIGLWVAWSERAALLGDQPLRPLVVLGVTGAALLAASGLASDVAGPLARWLAWADLPLVAGHAPGRVLLVAGLALANLATGNHVVRLVLAAIGALRPADPTRPVEGGVEQASDRLRGGRLLGAMERLLILGLGLAGEVAAASIVIAAKGLLRFPELQATRDQGRTVSGVGIDEVTEYFLVGSFVSWLLALSSLALTR